MYGEQFGTDDGVVALNTYEGEGGKTLSGAKLRLYWRLKLDGRLHEINFTNSKNSGKKRIFVDGNLVHEEKVYRSWNFAHTWSIGCHLLSIVPQGDGGSSPRNIFSTKATKKVLRVPQHPHDLVFAEHPHHRCDICQQVRGTGTRFRCAEGCDYDVCAGCYDERGMQSSVSPEFELRINGLPFSSFARRNGGRFPPQTVPGPNTTSSRPPYGADSMGRPPAAARPPATQPPFGASPFRPPEVPRRDDVAPPENEGSVRYPFHLPSRTFTEKAANAGDEYTERKPRKPDDPWQSQAPSKPDNQRQANKDVGFGFEPPRPARSNSQRKKSDWSLTPRRNKSTRSVSPRGGSGDYRGLMDASSDDEDFGDGQDLGFMGAVGKPGKGQTQTTSATNVSWGAPSPWSSNITVDHWKSQPQQASPQNPWGGTSSSQGFVSANFANESANSWASQQVADPWSAQQQQQQTRASPPATPRSRARKIVPTQLLPWEPTVPGTAATGFQAADKQPIWNRSAPTDNLESAAFLDTSDKQQLNSADIDEQKAIMASLQVVEPSTMSFEQRRALFETSSAPETRSDSEPMNKSPKAGSPDPWGLPPSSTPWPTTSTAFGDEPPQNSWATPLLEASSEKRKSSIGSDPWTAVISDNSTQADPWAVASKADPWANVSVTKVTQEASSDPWGIFDVPNTEPKKAAFPDPWGSQPQLDPAFSVGKSGDNSVNNREVGSCNPFEESDSSPSSPSSQASPDVSEKDPWCLSSKSSEANGWPTEGWPMPESRNNCRSAEEEAENHAKDQVRAGTEQQSRHLQDEKKAPRRNLGASIREALHNAEASGVQPGATIRVFGLTGAAHLNGLCGVVERFDSSSGRWIVVLDNGETKSLRPTNCAVQSSPDRSSPSKPAIHRPSIEKSAAETELQDLFPQVDLPVIQQALAICHDNVQVAADWLAEHIPEDDLAFPTQCPTSPTAPTRFTMARRKALLIGINYFGTQAELRGCINDVWSMKRLLIEQFGWDSNCMRFLVDDNANAMPTKANIDAGIRWLVEGVQPGDILFFHFSGHGAQQEDPEGYEEDGMNETICPVDFQKAGMMSDDEIGEVLVKHLPEGVRLTAVMDCCHSGTGLDLPFTWKGRSWKEETNPYHSAADVQLFSGCEDDDCSADAVSSYGAAGGAMTTAFCDVLRAGPAGLSYPELMANLDKLMRKRRFSQRPQLTSSQEFNVERPFGLDDAVSNSNPRLGRIFRRRFPPRPRQMSGPLAGMLDDAGLLVFGGVMAASALPMAMDMGSGMFGMGSSMGGMANGFFEDFFM